MIQSVNCHYSKLSQDFANVALTDEPEFNDPSMALRHYFNEFESDKLQLVRFSVPSKYKSMKNEHKVFLVVSLKEAKQNEDDLEPDWFFRQKIRAYQCSCQNGRRLQGSCVHVQCALYGATLNAEQKRKFKRKESILGSETFKNTFNCSKEEDEAEEGEEYFRGESNFTFQGLTIFFRL